MLERLFALEIFGIKLGLANITSLCEALGHPERSFTTVHVGGTNGKGSATAMIHAGLLASGLHAARYTSPHLSDIRERFVIGAEPVDAASLHAAAERVLDAADALVASGALPAPPTFFEATTAIAFELFRSAGVRIAVIEVGLGGRFDATNVITPAVSVITSLGMDHQQQLGETLASIAREKAGILKPGVPGVIGPLAGDAEAVVRGIGAERGATVLRAWDDAQATVRVEAGLTALDITTSSHRYGVIGLGLRGDHQIDNAVVALRTMEVLRDRGVAISFEAMARGLSDVVWPGRLEWLELAGGRRALLDAAHNPDGAAALARYLSRWHADRPPLVFAAMRDKHIERMLRALLPAVGTVITTAPDTSRAMDPATLADVVRGIDPGRRVLVTDEPNSAVERAFNHGSTVCVAGSIFLIGAVRDALRQRAILR